jgi:hypothetical protein
MKQTVDYVYVFIRNYRAVISTHPSCSVRHFQGIHKYILVMKLLSVIPVSLTVLFIRLPVFVRSRHWVFSV